MPVDEVLMKIFIPIPPLNFLDDMLEHLDSKPVFRINFKFESTKMGQQSQGGGSGAAEW